MNIKEAMLKEKGKWLITYKDKSKIVMDLDIMMYDTIEWYKVGELNTEVIDLDALIKGANKVERMRKNKMKEIEYYDEFINDFGYIEKGYFIIRTDKEKTIKWYKENIPNVVIRDTNKKETKYPIKVWNM